MHSTVTRPLWALIVPLAAALMVVAGMTGLIDAGAGPMLVLAAVLLGAAVFAAVHHAEVIAARLGEPFGSIVLAVAVTAIEVALIVSIMASTAPGSDEVARDTVFSAIMIVLNGVIGLCLVLGGQRHREQSFQLPGASAALAVLGTLAVLVMILPNFSEAIPGPKYSAPQLVYVATVSLVLYATFIFVQTIRHRDYFLEAADDEHDPGERPGGAATTASLGLLLVSLAAVVLLAKVLSYPLDEAVASAGLPRAVVGVVIATVVLLPEGIASVRAALANRLQNSINLVLGSALASIGLTIPVVTAVALLLDRTLTLGLAPQSMVLLALTLFVGTLTLGTGRTTLLHGVIHLGIFGTFLLLSVVP
ncbi:ionic transporter y4hA [Reyranella sp.]|jgi:Ca2+:H+ antiporter|uniref:calcium:proton antiporter n=1 Tax=Reyranella sp. TaxID=1929291 RepID=UPI002F91FEEB